MFLDYLFEKRKGHLCLATASSSKADFRQHFFKWPENRDLIGNFIEEQQLRKNVWFCVNLLSQPERKKEYCLPSSFAWSDLDAVVPTVAEEQDVPLPTCVVESSPSRYQAYWKIDGDTVPPDIAEEFSKKLAYKLGADKSGWDLTQLLRVPWTNNLKYDPPVQTKLLTIESNSYPIEFFDKIELPQVFDQTETGQPIEPLPDTLPNLDNILYKYKTEGKTDEEFSRLYSNTPDGNSDWSKILWRFLHKCFEMGMEEIEVLVVAHSAGCNKYRRDNRPPSYLWRDVQKAAQAHRKYQLVLAEKTELLTMPHLVDFDEFEEDAFIRDYKEWANAATDAPEQYHELTCFIALSATMCSGLWLGVEWGELVPNLWGLVLGESTLTRKAQPLDAKILTPTGWKLMGDIQVGDEVISQDGKSTKVVGVFPQGEKEIFKVSFGDGSSTECTIDHLWTFKGQGSKSEYKTWPLSKICTGGLRYGNSSQWIRHIPIVEPIEFYYQPDPIIEPYALGLLIGDGGMSQDSIRFTNHLGDAKLVSSLMDGLKPLDVKIATAHTNGETIDYRIVTTSDEHRGFSKGRVNKLIDALRELGLMGKLSNEKFVPDQYKFGSIEARLAILQGLMDSDGWVDNSGKSAVFCSSSLQLALDVRDMVWSLGGWSSIKQNKLDAWNVRVNLPEQFKPFRLARKLDKLQRIAPRARTMRDVQKVGIKQCQCIKVENPSGLYVTNNFIVTHNTTAMRLAIDMLKDIDESLILASDGSAEGLLTGLSHRPKRVSIFWKDEVSGFFDSINRKDYLAGFPETLTQLYDVPKIYHRMLRKETISVSEPYFIFFGGGIRDKVYSLISEEYITSGFIPRFLVVSGENDLSRVRRTGPRTELSDERKGHIVNQLANLKEKYNITVEWDIGGQKTQVPARIEARLTPEAWTVFQDIEEKLVNAGANSDISMLALPTFQRMGFSCLKMALLIAATRREPDSSNRLIVEVSDIKQAAFYIERWGHYSIELLLNAGKSQSEKMISRAMGVVNRKDNITKSELMQRLHLTAREAKELIDTMTQRGLIDVKGSGRGIRIYPV